jgi:hypothetical protein
MTMFLSLNERVIGGFEAIPGIWWHRFNCMSNNETERHAVSMMEESTSLSITTTGAGL